MKLARVAITRLTVAAVSLGLASHAAAWDDAPVCAVALPEPLSSEVEPNASEPLACLPPDAELPVAVPVMSQVDAEAVRASYERAEALTRDGKLQDAVLALREVEHAMPRIADRIALRRADLLLKLDMPKEACEAYGIAEDSPERSVAARGQIGMVHCQIASGSRTADKALSDLLRRYPLLSERYELRLELALSRMQSGKRGMTSAAAVLRAIDLEAPVSGAAARARRELGELAAQGISVKPYSQIEQVERTERMLKEAPVAQTQAEITRILALPKLSAEARTRMHLLAARIARFEGRWDDATEEARQVGKGPSSAEAGKLVSPAAAAIDTDAALLAAAQKRERQIRGNKPIARVRNAQLYQLLDLALDHGMRELCDEVLDQLAKRKTIFAGPRFDSAMRSTGLASEDKLIALLQTVVNVPTYRIAARYHLARAYERSGRAADAAAEYSRVVGADRGSTPYYAMWASQRLSSLRVAPPSAPGPVRAPDSVAAASTTLPAVLAGSTSPGDGGSLDASHGGLAIALNSGRSEPAPSPLANSVRAPLRASAEDLDDLDSLEEMDGVQLPAGPAPAPEPEVPMAQRPAKLRELLAPLAARHGEAYPWIARALDLVALGAYQDAADELSEAYLAWRDVTGAPRLRSGLPSLLTGNAPPRRAVSGALRAGRRALDSQSRQALSSAARLLGDAGIGLRLGSLNPDIRPRAYADLVASAARKYGVDPNLLFAVMRVESIYNRRIISTAGAIGLMQIMPATGRRIASELGVEDFEASDLLDPRVNLEFSAWYLASLIKRFDGRLPLAIASYNGGPHNVRLWIRQSNPDIPLDAFLERIPFSQTHRYVRRVLTHYAAYLAQQKKPMTPLQTEIPKLSPDNIAF